MKNFLKKLPFVFFVIVLQFKNANANNVFVSLPIDTSYYTFKGPSTIGTGKFYLGREIAGLGCNSSAHCDREFKNSVQRDYPSIMKAIPLEMNNSIADIGCGFGMPIMYLLNNGKKPVVYAEEINSDLILKLNRTYRFFRNKRLKFVLGTCTDINLPDSSLDVALMIDVYHELEFPVEMLKSVKKCLKNSGFLTLVEYKQNCPIDCVGELHQMNPLQLEKELSANGFALVKTIPFSYHNVFIFKKTVEVH